MNSDQARKFLRALNVPAVSEGVEWFKAPCPLAPWKHKGGTDASPSFGINLKGAGHVYCFACGFAGSLTKLVMELRLSGADNLLLGEAMIIAAQSEQEAPAIDLPLTWEEMYEAGPRPVTPFPNWFREMFEPAIYADADNYLLHPYLASRDVSYGFAEIFDVRVDAHNSRIVFPIRDRAGTLAGMHGRSYVGAVPPYYVYPYEGVTNRHVWFGEHLINTDLPVLMVESVFDFAAVWDVYKNVLSPLSASISADALFRIRWCSNVVLMFDADAAGNKARTHVRLACPPGTKFHDVWCPEDHDPGDLDRETIEELLYTPLGQYI